MRVAAWAAVALVVAGCDPASAPPTLTGPAPDAAAVPVGGRVALSVEATSPDWGAKLVYRWTATNGVFVSERGDPVVARLTGPTAYWKNTASEGRGVPCRGTIEVEVTNVPTGSPMYAYGAQRRTYSVAFDAAGVARVKLVGTQAGDGYPEPALAPPLPEPDRAAGECARDGASPSP